MFSHIRSANGNYNTEANQRSIQCKQFSIYVFPKKI
jgi:hypothetical protein